MAYQHLPPGNIIGFNPEDCTFVAQDRDDPNIKRTLRLEYISGGGAKFVKVPPPSETQEGFDRATAEEGEVLNAAHAEQERQRAEKLAEVRGVPAEELAQAEADAPGEPVGDDSPAAEPEPEPEPEQEQEQEQEAEGEAEAEKAPKPKKASGGQRRRRRSTGSTKS